MERGVIRSSPLRAPRFLSASARRTYLVCLRTHHFAANRGPSASPSWTNSAAEMAPIPAPRLPIPVGGQSKRLETTPRIPIRPVAEPL